MFHHFSGRITKTFYLSAILLVIYFFIPNPGVAESNLNNPPQITSQPILSITADQEYSYEISATDQDGDAISYSLSVSPNKMTLNGNVINWLPTKVGTYNIILEANDQKGGYDTQSWQLIVTPGNIETIIVKPNDRPTLVNIGSSKQFVAEAFDQNNNVLTITNGNWTTDEQIGSIDSSGMFYAKQGGIGYVALTSGDVSASVGVIVIDIRNELITQTEAADQTSADAGNSDISTESTETPDSASDNTINNTENTESTETPDSISIDNGMVAGDTTEADGNEEKDEACTNLTHWIIILILFIYGIIMIAYFQFEKKNQSAIWWIFPILVTIIGLVIYYRNICPNAYLWWPWVFIAIGVLITIYYKGRKKSELPPEDSQSHFPF